MTAQGTLPPKPVFAALPAETPRRKPTSVYLTQALRHVGLIAALVFFMFPIYYMLTSSLKTHVELFEQPPTWLPVNPSLDGYIDLFANRQFGRALINSLIVVSITVVLSMVLGTLAAYSLARFRLPKRLNGILAFWILSTRMVPPIVTIVPM